MIYYLCMGSNQGEKKDYLDKAIKEMKQNGIEILTQSSVYLTEPVDFPDQPWFYNQVIKVQTHRTPEELLNIIKQIEKKLGRTHSVPKGPRQIDIDILLANGLIYESKSLVIPHPGLEKRNFVLIPLNEIAPDVVHPVRRKTIASLLNESPDRSRVIVEKTLPNKEKIPVNDHCD